MIDALVAENNPTILKLITHHLEERGCHVRTASDGLQALVEIDHQAPDILFTDIIMPKVSGDQLCTIIRNDQGLKDMFIAVHSSTSLEDNRAILGIDADVYIAKGPATNLKDHVHHVVDQFKKGARRDQITIGKDTLHPREITRELLLARKHHHAIFNNVAEAVIEMDSSGTIVQANVATQELLQRDPIKILSSRFTDVLEESEREQVTLWMKNLKKGGSLHYRTSHDTPIEINTRKIYLNLVAIAENDDFFIIGILQDITRQKHTEKRLEKTVEEFNAVINTIDYGILLLDADLRLRIANHAYRTLWKIPKSFTDTRPSMRDIMQHNVDQGLYNLPSGNANEYINARLKAIGRGAIPPMELRRADGKILQYQCAVLPDNGRLLTYYEITTLKNTEQKLEEALAKVSDLANHDPLTSLPNLRLARERLLSALSFAKRKGWMAALMFIDLDGFKEVNDSYGHDTGDKVLRAVASRLNGCLRQADTVARIGGDEFLVIQTEVPHRFAVVNVADKIIETISTPFKVDDIEINLGASIGISLFPDNGEESRELMRKADDAMYYTKRIGKNGYSFSPN